MTMLRQAITREHFDAILFDLDGVLTSTARIHAACWKAMFDEYLRQRAAATGEPFRPFEIATDYLQYVDGKPRYEGVRSFLESRSIDLPEGDPGDPAGKETICGLGNRKDQHVKEAIRQGGVEAYPASITWVHQLLDKGMKTAVVTSSRNCDEVLQAAGIADLFEAKVDGNVVADLGLRGKPAPDAFLRAAELLGVAPGRAVVVEDAVAGVEAGKAGKFGLVIGVDRGGHSEALRAHGADLVVKDLAELLD